MVGLAGRFGGDGRARPAQRRDPRARGHRLLRPPAAGLHLQDRYHHRRARARAREASTGSRSRRRDRRRRRAGERERRVLRRLVPRELRPLVQLGVRAARGGGGCRGLVAAAERFGWNARPTIPGEAPSTLPRRSRSWPLEVGSSAIGQFRTLATPLQLASLAQVIAGRGVRRPPPLALGGRPRGVARDLAPGGADDRARSWSTWWITGPARPRRSTA